MNERKDMNKNKTRVPTEFGPETRFELRPAPPAPFRATQETEFERLKTRLLAEQLAGAPAGIERSAAARGQRGGGAGMGDILSPAGVPGAVRGKNRRRVPPGRTAGAHLREQPRTARRMKTQRQLEVGTMRVRACRAEALHRRGAVCTGEMFRARANGFSPRFFVSGE